MIKLIKLSLLLNINCCLFANYSCMLMHVMYIWLNIGFISRKIRLIRKNQFQNNGPRISSEPVSRYVGLNPRKMCRSAFPIAQ